MIQHEPYPIFERLWAGQTVSFDDPDYGMIHKLCAKTFVHNNALNSATDIVAIRKILGEVTGREIDRSTTVFVPFHFTEARANVLTNPVLDPVSKIPEFKVCAARVEKEAVDGKP